LSTRFRSGLVKADTDGFLPCSQMASLRRGGGVR
jgi:hypothetical protein